MKVSLVGWSMIAISALGAIGLFLSATLFSGEVIAQGTVWQADRSSPELVANVMPDDEPVRLVLTARGVRRGAARSVNNRSVLMSIDLGDGGEPISHVFRPRPKANASQPNRFNTHFTIDIDQSRVGAWRIALDATPGQTVELESVDLQVRSNVRTPNLPLIIATGLLALIGTVLLVLTRRR